MTRAFTSTFSKRIDSKGLFIVETFKELTCSYVRTEETIKNRTLVCLRGQKISNNIVMDGVMDVSQCEAGGIVK